MDYIGRDVWGAQYAAGSGSRPIPCAEAWLHHTVTKHLPVDAIVAHEAEQMRVVERIGQSRFGAGFSYNLAVFPSGRVYVGCGVRRVGTHTARRNTRALGIVLVGDYDRNTVSPQTQAALVEVLRDAKRLGWLRAPRLDGGHRDLSKTACPGRHGYALIPTVNALAAGQQPAPIFLPPNVKGPAMMIVQHPDGPEQYLCDVTHARHIGGPEREVLVAGGVPYVGEEHASDDARRAFLMARGVEGL